MAVINARWKAESQQTEAPRASLAPLPSAAARPQSSIFCARARRRSGAAVRVAGGLGTAEDGVSARRCSALRAWGGTPFWVGQQVTPRLKEMVS